MKRLCKLMAGAISILFIFASCGDNNSNYPQKYIGFDKTTKDYTFDKSKDVEEFDVKIIAMEKQDEDREVIINGITMPGKEAVFSITDRKIVIPAKKKSANVRVRIYPKKIKNKTNFRIVCIPQDKEAKKTEIRINLNPQ